MGSKLLFRIGNDFVCVEYQRPGFELSPAVQRRRVAGVVRGQESPAADFERRSREEQFDQVGFRSKGTQKTQTVGQFRLVRQRSKV